MYIIEVSEFIELTQLKQAEFLSRFLFNMTVGVRSIYLDNKNNIKRQLYGVNNIYHMVIPLMNSILFGYKQSYTIEIIAENLQDIGLDFDIEGPIATAWEQTRTTISQER